ncbi:MAG: aminotransferase class I/II-fold pyridoxal phosphate-dependent enzyme [Flavobacteriaceae bacterium]|jgi:hypothetical protein|nr:aminotransferase class I/II-fold pyridoxal phosphate-dependent enzyme [Flavobacteriaceae bacterium]
MTTWSFCPNQVKQIIETVTLKNKGNHLDLKVYKDLWLKWTKDFSGSEKYQQWAICNGIHDALIQQIAYRSKTVETFYIFKTDYRFYKVILNPYNFIEIDKELIHTILPNSYVIVSQPNHEGGITQWFKELVEHCTKVKTKIFLDCAFFGTTLDKMNVYNDRFDCVAFSLSKNFMLGGFRAGIVFGNDLAKTLTVPIDHWYNYSYYNSCAVELAKVIMPKFKATYITEIAKSIQIEHCKIVDLEPCDIWMMGKNKQGERINLIDQLQHKVQYELDNKES